jgi:hypothetical protein
MLLKTQNAERSRYAAILQSRSVDSSVFRFGNACKHAAAALPVSVFHAWREYPTQLKKRSAFTTGAGRFGSLLCVVKYVCEELTNS